ncbi:MAG TPA: ribosome maturation factor RimM [Levilinea sp.]|nr:ribosome maturation factor RimM [Levilinea sp.]
MKDPKITSPDQETNPTGSPETGEPEFLAIGTLLRAHGIEGDIVMSVLTDFPERLRPGKTVFTGEEHRPLQILRTRPHGKNLIVSFKGIDNREMTALYRGQMVYVRTENVPRLPAGEYYYHQLIGLAVIDEQGTVLGTIDRILETRANDVYIIKTPDGSELLLPAVEDEVVLGVDLERREMRVRPPVWE